MRSLAVPKPSSNPSTHIANSVFCRGPLVPGDSSISERGGKKAVGGGGKEMKGGKERKRERAFCVGNTTTYLGVII